MGLGGGNFYCSKEDLLPMEILLSCPSPPLGLSLRPPPYGWLETQTDLLGSSEPGWPPVWDHLRGN